MKGVTHTTPEGREFALKLMKKLKDAVTKWKKETGLDLHYMEHQQKAYATDLLE